MAATRLVTRGIEALFARIGTVAVLVASATGERTSCRVVLRARMEPLEGGAVAQWVQTALLRRSEVSPSAGDMLEVAGQTWTIDAVLDGDEETVTVSLR